MQRRIQHDRSKAGVMRRVERIDPVRGFDGDDQVLIAVPEGRASNWWNAGSDELVEQTPPGELEHTAAHQRVCARCRRAVWNIVEQQGSHVAASEQHRRRRARCPCADDDDVVCGAVAKPGWLIVGIHRGGSFLCFDLVEIHKVAAEYERGLTCPFLPCESRGKVEGRSSGENRRT